jgi:hypothetical protein
MGVASRSVSLTISATVPELLAKMAAMAAHGSQIAAEWLDPSAFGQGYGCEWFVRRGAPGILESLAASTPATAAAKEVMLVGAGKRAGDFSPS